MTPNDLSALWTGILAAGGNHLWQSTLCLVAAGLLALILRKNHARTRYGLWFAASIKFLIPFSLLVVLGAHLAASRGIPASQSGWYVALADVSQPFTPPATRAIPPAVPSGTSSNLVHLLPAFLLAVWLCGFLAVLLRWYARWRRISVRVHTAAPLREGREAQALRRLERRAGIRNPIHLLLSPDSLEPGIFGIRRPLLMWPQGISKRLDDAHLDAILAHEVWHVRRRDNLAAAIQMVVEAFFWFHPLVWWLTARLVEERERACDEEVLASGSEPRVYAEGILRTCEFCLASPLACVSGITGADLKQRVIRIMTQSRVQKLSAGRKLVLTATGVAAIAAPLAFGLLNGRSTRAQSAPSAAGPLPSFEVASIKPNRTSDLRRSFRISPGRFTTTGVTAKSLIAFAYDVKEFQVSGGPGWINSERYDIEAKEEDADIATLQKLPFDQRGEQLRLRLQSLLADRFKLKLGHETRELPVYALVVAKNGPRLSEAKPGDTYLNGIKGPDGRPAGVGGIFSMGPGQVTGQGLPISALVRMLSQQMGRDVLDQTGLKGSYDFSLKWAADQSQLAMLKGPEGGPPPTDNAAPPDASGPSIFTAIQEQLGLKLESTKGPVEILVVDQIEKPSEN